MWHAALGRLAMIRMTFEIKPWQASCDVLRGIAEADWRQAHCDAAGRNYRQPVASRVALEDTNDAAPRPTKPQDLDGRLAHPIPVSRAPTF